MGDWDRGVKSPNIRGFYRKSPIWRSKVQVFEGQLSGRVPPPLAFGTFWSPLARSPKKDSVQPNIACCRFSSVWLSLIYVGVSEAGSATTVSAIDVRIDNVGSRRNFHIGFLHCVSTLASQLRPSFPISFGDIGGRYSIPCQFPIVDRGTVAATLFATTVSWECFSDPWP